MKFIFFCRYLVLEYVGGGELFEYLVKKKRLQVMEVQIIFINFENHMVSIKLYQLLAG